MRSYLFVWPFDVQKGKQNKHAKIKNDNNLLYLLNY